MEQRNAKSESVSSIGDDHNTGTWIIALISNGKGYLGRVAELNGEDAYKTPQTGDPQTGQGFETRMVPRDQVPADEVMDARRVMLFPVYDYREMVKEVPVVHEGKMVQNPDMPGVPMMQPMRTPLVMPVGFTLEPHPVHVPGLCYGTTFRFLSQMDRRDADTHRGFARDTRNAMLAARAQASNLVVASPDDLTKLRRR